MNEQEIDKKYIKANDDLNKYINSYIKTIEECIPTNDIENDRDMVFQQSLPVALSSMLPDPNIVWHYTKLENLEAILKNGLGLFPSNQMNDTTEGLDSFRLFDDLIKQKPPITDELGILIDDIENNLYVEFNLQKKYYEVNPSYFVSLSANRNLLSQWRAYGDDGKGISLGFDYKKLQEIKSYNCAEINLNKCVYFEGDKIIYKLIKKIIPSLFLASYKYDLENNYNKKNELLKTMHSLYNLPLTIKLKELFDEIIHTFFLPKNNPNDFTFFKTILLRNVSVFLSEVQTETRMLYKNMVFYEEREYRLFLKEEFIADYKNNKFTRVDLPTPERLANSDKIKYYYPIKETLGCLVYINLGNKCYMDISQMRVLLKKLEVSNQSNIKIEKSYSPYV